MRGVDRAFRSAPAPTKRVQLIDEQDDLAVRLLDLVQHGLQSILKFAAELGAREHGTEVERDDALIAQDLRNVALEDAAGEAFDDGCFAHAGFPDQHRVVFRPAAEHLDHAPNFFVAADHRVELAAASLVGQVLGVLGQRLELAFRVLIRNPLRSRARPADALRIAAWSAPTAARAAATGSPFAAASASSRCSVET